MTRHTWSASRMPYPTHLILYLYIVMNWMARCAGNCALQCHTFHWNSKFGVVIMPQEKQCRASVVGCKELPQRDGSRMDSICLYMGNVACLCIPSHEVCRLMWKNWVFYTYGVYCSHSTLLWQNILETLMQPIS